MPEDVDIFIDEKDKYSDRRDQIPYEKRIKELEDRVAKVEELLNLTGSGCSNPNCGCRNLPTLDDSKPDGGG